MFYDGDLQSGIATALQESKSVVCFVKGDNEESLLWENDYLVDEDLLSCLAERAVVLRIQLGSREADYLSAFHPVSTAPTLIIIHVIPSNGQLRSEIRGSVVRNQFKESLLAALSGSPKNGSVAPSNSNTENSSTIYENRPPSLASETGSGNVRPNPAVQDVLEERRRRLDIDKKAKDATDKEERIAKAQARRAEAKSAVPDSAKGKQVNYAQEQRRRQQAARDEHKRILKVIENDKVERRHREELRKASAKAEAAINNDGADGLVDQQLSNEVSQSRPTVSKKCAIQVRSFDGSIMRSRFSSDRTLGTDVRRWVDHTRSDGDTPYTFKQILAPLPNRSITISEEEETLQSLGLTPSATLIMIPVQGYTAAYAGGPGIVSRGLSSGYSIVSGGVSMVTDALGTFLGIGQAAAVPAETAAPEHSLRGPTGPTSNDSRSSTNVRTIRDQHEGQDDQQFYNGNQLNFEPRKDENDMRD